MKYYIGLDMGTNSVGYAVADEEYKLLKAHQKPMIGVRLFDEAQTAAKRRLARVNRRRMERRRQRLALLEDLFSPVISKVDPGFFQRLKESFFMVAHKTEEQPNTLFNDPDFTDRNYHKKYPTIYHLRHELMTSQQPHDVRLVFLAIHHILKHRGHFLNPGELGELGGQLQSCYSQFLVSLSEDFAIELPPDIADQIQAVLTDKTTRRSEKQELLKQLFAVDDDMVAQLSRLFAGLSANISKLFGEQYKEQSPKDVSFSGAGFEDEKQIELQQILTDSEFSLLQSAFNLYAQIQLDSLLQGYPSFSASKIGLYEKHKSDLKRLKKLLKTNLESKAYTAYFSESKKDFCNYVAYSGHCLKNKKKQPVAYRCQKTAFYEELKKILAKLPESIRDGEEVKSIQLEIENETFLPKQVSKDNSLIPNQLQLSELRQILKNAATYLPFLNRQGEDGLTISEMIEKIADFRIPYYVGPVNPAHRVIPGKPNGSRHAWVTKISAEPVRPWNFERVIDLEQSATDFINNLTNKCTYLIGEDVLSKDSPTYARFMLLNILNLLSVNGQRLPVLVKQNIYNDLFLHPKTSGKVTKKKICAYLNAEGYPVTEAELGGMDLEIPISLKAERQLEALAPGKLSLEDKEEIVRLITVFPESNRMLRNRFSRQFGNKLTQSELTAISKLKFAKWGQLSRKFLTGLRANGPDGRETTILEAMWDYNLNLMELLSQDYGFADAVKQYKQDMLGDQQNFSYSLVDQYPTSPAVKKMIWQTMKIVDEIIRIRKQAPEKIFIEVAREEGEKKRTTSRLDQIKQIFKANKDIEDRLKKELDTKSEENLRRKKLYLYFTQLGRCIYTGKAIDLEKLDAKDSANNDFYDIDHIYPRSQTKDDSLMNNLVLVESSANRQKGDDFPIVPGIQAAQKGWWTALKDKKLISEEKYRRLVRTTPLSPEELESFISRQLVQTRQATKAVAELLKLVFPESRVVFVKAGHVSDFRYEQNAFRFPKVRGMNDLHHAKDAYLNIVVGNVFDTKFTQDVRNYIKNHPKRDFNLGRMYDFDVVGASGKLAWKTGEEGSIRMVRSMMALNAIQCTWQTRHQTSGQNGGLFDQNLLPKGKGQFPIKTSNPHLAGQEGINNYGGYNKPTGATFFVVEHELRKKAQRTILPLDLTWVLTHEQTAPELEAYCRETLGLIESRVILADLPYNSILEVNGFPLRLLAKTGASLKLAPALQPYFPAAYEPILKALTRQAEEGKDAEADPRAVYPPEENLALYDHFTQKLGSEPYSRLSVFVNQYRNLSASRGNFILLTPFEQMKVLGQILILFLCDGRTSDLSLLQPKNPNGTPSSKNKQSGMVTISQNLQKGIKVDVLNFSCTGLFLSRTPLSQP